MTVTTRIRRQGGAAVMTIPPALLKLMGAEIGSELALVVEEGALVASPARPSKRRYSLAELLEGHDVLADLGGNTEVLPDDAPTGREAL